MGAVREGRPSRRWRDGSRERGGRSRGATADDVRALCHDVRQPLATIAALVAAAQAELSVPAAVARRLDEISAELDSLSELCDQVAGDRPGARSCRADVVAARVLESAGPAYATQLELHARPAVLGVDEVVLRRVLWNLVDFACRAAGDDGIACVSVRPAGGVVEIDVDDSGPGFDLAPDGEVPLGLTTVGELVRRSGGRVFVSRSEILGGARIRAVFPALLDMSDITRNHPAGSALRR